MPNLTVQTISPSENQSIIVTETVSNRVQASGGQGNYTYQWVVDGSNATGQGNQTNSYNYTPQTLGVHTIYCIVMDGATSINSTRITITVYSLYEALSGANGYLAKMLKAMS